MGWKEGGIVQSGHICCKRELDFGVTRQDRTTLFCASAESTHGTSNLVYTNLFPNVCSGPVTTIGSLHLL